MNIRQQTALKSALLLEAQRRERGRSHSATVFAVCAFVIGAFLLAEFIAGVLSCIQ